MMVARARLDSGVMEEVDHGRPPTPLKMKTGTGNKSTHLPSTLLSELQDIQRASEKLLANMENMENGLMEHPKSKVPSIKYLATPVSFKSVGSPKSNRVVKRTADRFHASDKKLNSSAGNIRSRSYDANPVKNASDKKKVARSENISFPSNIPEKKPSKNEPLEGYPNTLNSSRNTESGISNLELESLRREVESLKSVVNLKSSLQATTSETLDLINSFPGLEKTLQQLESNASTTVRDLHKKIELLTKSYRDMNQIAARAPLGFLSLDTPAEKRASWLPSLEPFDHDLLQTEMSEIHERKKRLDELIGSTSRIHTTGGTSSKISDHVAHRILRLNHEIQEFVDKSYMYAAMNRKKQTVKRDDYLSPWMVPSQGWDDQLQRQKMNVPAALPIVPRVLKEHSKRMHAMEKYHRSLAQMERPPEVVVVPRETESPVLIRQKQKQNVKYDQPLINMKKDEKTTTKYEKTKNATVLESKNVILPESNNVIQPKSKGAISLKSKDANDSVADLLNQLDEMDIPKKVEKIPKNVRVNKTIRKHRLEQLMNVFDEHGDPYCRALQLVFEFLCSFLTESLPFFEIDDVFSKALESMSVVFLSTLENYHRTILERVAKVENRTEIIALCKSVSFPVRPLKVVEVICLLCGSYQLVSGHTMNSSTRSSLLALSLVDDNMIDAATLSSCIDASCGVHSSLERGNASLRVHVSLQAAQAMFSSMTGVHLMPYALKAVIQGRALVDAFGTAIGDLEVSNVATTILTPTQTTSEIIQPTALDAIATKLLVSTIVNAGKRFIGSSSAPFHRYQRLILSERNKDKLTRLFIGEDFELDFENRDLLEIELLEFMVTLFWRAPCVTEESSGEAARALGVAAENAKILLYSAKSPRDGQYKFQRNLVRYLTLVDDSMKQSYSKSRYEEEDEKVFVPIHEKTLSPNPVTLKNEVEKLAETFVNNTEMIEKFKLTIEGMATNPSSIPTPTARTSMCDGAVVQWFIDKCQPVDEGLVSHLASEVSSSELPPMKSKEHFAFEDTGSLFERNVLDMVLTLVMEKEACMQPSTAKVDGEAKSDVKTLLEIVDDKESAVDVEVKSDIEQLVSTALSARLAIEATQAMVLSKESILMQKEKEIALQMEQLSNQKLEMQNQFANRAMAEKEDQLGKMESLLANRETFQKEMEAIRTSQFENAISRVGELQLSTFTAMMEQNLKSSIVEKKYVVQGTQVGDGENWKILSAGDKETKCDEVLVDSPNDDVLSLTNLELNVSQVEDSIAEEQESLEPKQDFKMPQVESLIAEEQDSLEPKQDLKISHVEPPIVDEQEYLQVEDSDKQISDHLADNKMTEQPDCISGDVGADQEIDMKAKSARESSSRKESRLRPEPLSKLFLFPQLALQNASAGEPKQFASTLLNWSDDESDSSSSSSESNLLSEGEIDVNAGDYSDGESVPLPVMFRSAVLPGMTAPPWDKKPDILNQESNKLNSLHLLGDDELEKLRKVFEDEEGFPMAEENESDEENSSLDLSAVF